MKGAELVSGGPGLPDGLSPKATTSNPPSSAASPRDMRIAREEVFGPVLAVMPYQDRSCTAIEVANDTEYGLAAYVQSDRPGPRTRRRQPDARRHRVPKSPCHGHRGALRRLQKSGNGREWSEWGLDDFTEIKGLLDTRRQEGLLF